MTVISWRLAACSRCASAGLFFFWSSCYWALHTEGSNYNRLFTP